MKYYIKRAVFTFLEACFLTILILFLKTNILPDPPFLSALFYPGIIFIFCLALIFLLRILWHRFMVWRILHFSIKGIDKMTGREFEDFLKLRFEHLGFTVQTTKASNDYGADLILQRKNFTIALQAKRYKGSIGVKAVQEVIGSMAYYEADKGLVVTNSFFTKNAQNLAAANNVALWNRDVLVCLLSGEAMTAYINALLDL